MFYKNFFFSGVILVALVFDSGGWHGSVERWKATGRWSIYQALTFSIVQYCFTFSI